MQSSILTKDKLQSLAQGGQAGPKPIASPLQANSGIDDLHPAPIAGLRDTDFDATPVLARIDTVSHGILDQRHERHRRAAEREGGFVDVQRELQPVG